MLQNIIQMAKHTPTRSKPMANSKKQKSETPKPKPTSKPTPKPKPKAKSTPKAIMHDEVTNEEAQMPVGASAAGY